jgi:alkanesulfonate monooxygenase
MSATDAHWHWWLPTFGDHRSLLPRDGDFRAPTFDYLTEVARAADRNGIEALLLATAMAAPDPWLLAAALAPVTQRIKFLVAFRAGFVWPTLAAQQAATFQEITGNRLYLNVVTGNNPAEQRAYGDQLDKAERYRRTDEFIEVMCGCWAGRPYSFSGTYYTVQDGGLPKPLAVPPLVFFSGSSDAAVGVAARHAEVQLIYGEPPPLAAPLIARVRDAAAEAGRTLSFGTQLHLIARPSSVDAWREADRLLDGLDPEIIERQQERIRSRDSAGLRRTLDLQQGTKVDREALKIHPTMWSGVGLAVQGLPTSVVGSYEEVAERLNEYRDIGVSHFILSGSPTLEELYHFGEGVLPLLEPARSSAGRAHRAATSNA